MSQSLFKDVINACLDELKSAAEGNKTIVYDLIVGNLTSSNTLLQLITTLDLPSSFGITFFVVNVLPKMAGLTSLNLSYNQIGEDGARSIAESTSLFNLTTLDLSGNQIGDDGVQSIAVSTSLSNLTSLNLDYNQIGEDGVRPLKGSITLSNLTTLNLEGNRAR